MRKNVFFQNLEIWIWDILEKTHTETECGNLIKLNSSSLINLSMI